MQEGAVLGGSPTCERNGYPKTLFWSETTPNHRKDAPPHLFLSATYFLPSGCFFSGAFFSGAFSGAFPAGGLHILQGAYPAAAASSASLNVTLFFASIL